MTGESVKRPRREYLPLRIGTAGREWVEQVALEEDGRDLTRRITRSDVVRAALVVARQHERELRTVIRGAK